jgi:hypothetical protein
MDMPGTGKRWVRDLQGMGEGYARKRDRVKERRGTYCKKEGRGTGEGGEQKGRDKHGTGEG